MKKTKFRPTLQWMICLTLDCVGLTQPGVIWIIHRNFGLKCFFHSPKCLLLLLVFLTFIPHKRRIFRVVGSIIIALLQFVRRVCQWRILISNWRRCGQKSSASFFVAHGVQLRFVGGLA